MIAMTYKGSEVHVSKGSVDTMLNRGWKIKNATKKTATKKKEEK